MEYQEHVEVLKGVDPALATEVAGLTNLEHVLEWMRQRSLPLASLDLVTQDEFCHDLLIPLEQTGKWLVFGCS